MNLHDAAASSDEARSVMPCVILSCSNCGLIQFHNVHKIGVAEVLGIPPPGEAI